MDTLTVVVPFSGGWDSTYCLLRACRQYGPHAVIPVFVNYGQPYLLREQLAVSKILAFLGTYSKLWIEKIDKLPSDAGIFAGRNERILRICARFVPDVIYFGSRNILPVFDKYGDSNWWFAKQMEMRLECAIRTPCTLMPKAWIKRVVTRDVPESFIYSTEGLL